MSILRLPPRPARALLSLLLILAVATTGCDRNHQTPVAAVPASTRFPNVDGEMTQGTYVDLDPTGSNRLFIRHCPIADTGVEIDRVQDGRLLWRQYVEPLGVEHSKYIHKVHYSRPPTLKQDEATFQIISEGAQIIYETRRLSDGTLIDRNIINH